MDRTDATTFDDPYAFQAAVKPAQVELLVTGPGKFKAELNRVELSQLWVQRGSENLPRIVNSATNQDRPPIFFLTRADQASISHSGRDFGFGEIVVVGSGTTSHHRTEGPCDWATLSITADDLAAAGHALNGRDPIDRSNTHYLRPPLPAMQRLLSILEAVAAVANMPAWILAQPEPTRALEQALLHVVVQCLGESAPVQIGRGVVHHNMIIARFEEFLAANYDRPLHLTEICAAVGASERTLRASCIEHLGIGPVRYLWLRRMHLARRALSLTAPGAATVTKIATDVGFWELGRFAVEYRTLFGESPSESLRRPAQEVRTTPSNPFAFVDSEFEKTTSGLGRR